MHASSPALTATLRALHGETDVHVVASTLGDQQFARILALAPGVDPVIGALGALAGELPDLLTPDECASPALAAAVASLIGTSAGDRILPTWAKIAPAGWGKPYAGALIDIANRGCCEPWVAAALIGPTNDAAALLRLARDIAVAIRRWGQATPNDPTAWMNTLSPEQQDRLLNALRHTPVAAAFCLSWLPCSLAAGIADLLSDEGARRRALNAYASASPVACTRHADILPALMQHANWFYLDPLTRLAVTSRMGDVWTAVVHLLRETPNDADLVVAAAPWNDVRADVQKIILSSANRDDVCAAIAFARGMRTQPPSITQATARAFFAAVTPEVWTALPAETQHAWRAKIIFSDIAVLAVRSLGPDPAFLAHTCLNDDVIAAVRRSTRDDNDLRHTLLPVAVRDLPIAALPVVVAALPPPSDPVAFIQIAGGSPTMPPALRAWITAHPTPQAMAAASTVLRAAARLATDPVADRCAALAAALAGWSREETGALLAALPDDAHAALRPDSNALACALARPDRRDAFRQALDALAALPPSAALPSLHALDALAQAPNLAFRRQAGASLAQALRNHGRIFADIVGALNDDARFAVLPRRGHPHDEAALFPLAVADPLVAHHLAHALWAGDMPAALDALAATPLDKMPGIWRLLPDTIRSAILGDGDALLTDVAAPGRADALAQTLQAWNADDPLALLALRMLIENDEARRARGAAILAQQPDMAASLLLLLREDLRALLVRDPRIAVAGADLPPPSSFAPTPMLPPRRRRSR